MKRRTLAGGLAIAAAALMTVLLPSTPAHAAISHKSPFDCGKTFYANNWTPGHSPSGAIDWQSYGTDAINGETVRATAAGTAYFKNAGSTSYGLWVEIIHSDGTSTRYAHLSSMVQSAGTSKSVGQGTKIGNVGSTGNSSAPHLHYEQRTSGGAVDTSPTVEGVTVSLGQKKAISSTNGCGSSNPYTAEEVCGSGYDVVDSAALGTVGKVFLTYNSSNGYNCVVTLKYVSVGTPSAVSAFLEPEGSTRTTDSGSFGYYAGPVKRSAPGVCVKWGGSVGSTSYTSGFEHCG
ncbi:MAG: M23 family metallopeptidase [Hamadaea sp.]|uniref:M23 family metallopeptidase n=1 Tax=Hamadaea sp. TaxID=2024425 RepID=UPI0017BD529F|nr:M23 family metallopeptidase [Hamadaea sp.]NUR72546.1 M23 family metallopeptidase [Hamadaea sp.]NUT20559.1 M23 family metallopeptidase [Hamadaea sp.]